MGMCSSLLLASMAGRFALGADPVSVDPSKILIVYYSWSGNTKFVAQRIQKLTGGTLVEITSEKTYPEEYSKCTAEAKKDIKAGFKPKLTMKIDNFDQYEVVFIGSPNWWSSIAPPVASFASSYNLEGKKVVPFVTHGGGGLAHCVADLKKLCPKAQFLKAGAFPGAGIRRAGSNIEKWVNEVITAKN